MRGVCGDSCSFYVTVSLLQKKQMLYSECWFLTKGQMYCWGKRLFLFYKNRCYRVVFLSIYEYQPLFQLLFCKVVVWIISLLLLRPWCLSVFSLSSCSVTGLATQLHGFAEEPSRCVFFFWTMGCRCFLWCLQAFTGQWRDREGGQREGKTWTSVTHASRKNGLKMDNVRRSERESETSHPGSCLSLFQVG